MVVVGVSETAGASETAEVSATAGVLVTAEVSEIAGASEIAEVSEIVEAPAALGTVLAGLAARLTGRPRRIVPEWERVTAAQI